jgi:hypothetical protein
MSPLELIKQGIIKQDWELVCQGYDQMTGESVVKIHKIGSEKKPATAKQTNDKIKELQDEEGEDLLNPVVQPSEKKGLLGNVTVLVTDGNPSRKHKTNEAERKFNKKRAEARGPRRVRSNSRTEVTCNECDKKFTSQYGKTDRKCKKCLMKHRQDLK